MVGRSVAVLIGAVGAAWPGAPARAATPPEPAGGYGGSGPIDLSIPPARDETITVMGHRPYVLAPLPGGGGGSGPAPSGIAPGSRLGPFVVTGGPVGGVVSNGVSAGVALPIRAVKGLEFDAGVTGSRDALRPAGTTGAAAVTAGLRLKF